MKQPWKYEWAFSIVDLGFMVYNLSKAITQASIIHYALAAMWLGVGIYCVVRSVRAYKLEKKTQQQEIVDPAAQEAGDNMNNSDQDNK